METAGVLPHPLEGQGRHPPVSWDAFPSVPLSLFDLQVEIPGPGSELKGVPSDKASQAAFQAPGASRDLSFFV